MNLWWVSLAANCYLKCWSINRRITLRETHRPRTIQLDVNIETTMEITVSKDTWYKCSICLYADHTVKANRATDCNIVISQWMCKMKILPEHCSNFAITSPADSLPGVQSQGYLWPGVKVNYITCAKSFFIIGSYVAPSAGCTTLGALPSTSNCTASPWQHSQAD